MEELDWIGESNTFSGSSKLLVILVTYFRVVRALDLANGVDGTLAKGFVCRK